MRRGRRTVLLVAAAAAAMIAAGCGSEEFPNDPRPPSPIELSAVINDKRIVLAPTETDGEPVGAGLANLTVSNQTPDDVQLTFSGPNDRTTDPIVANGVLESTLDLVEGTYRVSSTTGVRDAELIIGPERESSENELLLP